MEVCNLVYKVRKKVFLKLNAQKNILSHFWEPTCIPLITGQTLYSLSYRDSHGELILISGHESLSHLLARYLQFRKNREFSDKT